ncbi:MAG: VWA domain-containing protein [Deltaproteobacteria bacterium]|nr:MAG: VWA domain-containing protein [Deltaproteobacteria bacterium]
MNVRTPWFVGLVVSSLWLGAAPALARSADGPGAAPYLERDGRPADPAATPLVATNADVDISGDVAHVTLTQLYSNLEADPIEVVYVFPGSTRAAVTGLTMTVGDREIVARIHERQEAREVYEEAKDAGKTATLLEMTRPNELRMSVANILPGESIQVEVEYVERLRSDDGVYELVLPGPVAPRYDGEAAPDAASEAGAPTVREPRTAIPYVRPGTPWGPIQGISVDLQAAVPIDAVSSPSHALPPLRDPSFYHYTYADLGERPRDFVLRYRLGADTVATGVVRYDAPDGQRYFMATVQPPLRVAPGAIAPREYVFILDVSGSMGGWPLETAKALMTELLGGLRPMDTFNVVAFAGGSEVLSERSLPATPANTRRVTRAVDGMGAMGGTELLHALRTSFALPATPGVARTFVVVSDGFVTVTPEAYRLIRERLGDANLFAFGIGDRPNRDLIERVAAAGRGEPFVVMEESEAFDAAQRFRDYIEAPILTDVQLSYAGLAPVDVTPAAVPDLFAQRPLVVTGKLAGEGQGEIVVTGRGAFGPFSAVIDVGAVRPDPAHAAIATFWARDRVADLDDREAMGEEVKAEIVKIGLAHHLLTRHTSFVAVDERVRHQDGAPRTVVQPLPGHEGAPGAPSVAFISGLGSQGRRIAVDMKVVAAKTGKISAVMGGDGLGGGIGGGGMGFAGSGQGGSGVGAGRIGGIGDLEIGGGPGVGLPGGGEGKSQRIRGRIKLELKKVVGALAEGTVNIVVRRNMTRFRYCYERELMKNPNLKGKVQASFTIDAGGRVRDVKVTGSLTEPVHACLERSVRQMRFKSSEEGKKTTVGLSMIFVPSS